MIIPPGEEEFPEASDFVIDRPFYFTIQHRPTDTILFLGRMMEIGKPANSPDDINVTMAKPSPIRRLYDLQGRALRQAPAKGVYIQEGKKHLKWTENWPLVFAKQNLKQDNAIIKLEDKKLAQLKTGSLHLAEKYGERGTPSREDFEAKAKAWYHAELWCDERKRQKLTWHQLGEL